jgi:predicted nucleic acid-binding protein
MTQVARVLVDTGPILRQLRNHQPTIQLLRELRRGDRLGISVITRLEVRARMHEHERYDTQKLLARFVTFDVATDIADLAGDLIARSRTSSLLSLPDAIIAATALLGGLTLVTYNVAHFAQVRGLRFYSLLPDN